MKDNPYIPVPVTVSKVINEVDTNDIKTFRLTFLNREDEEKFKEVYTLCTGWMDSEKRRTSCIAYLSKYNV